MDTGNYRRRVLHKLAEDLELPKLIFSGHSSPRRYIGAREGNDQRHSGAASAFAHGHHDRCAHAGAAGRRRRNGGCDKTGAQKEAEKGEAAKTF